jgi:hypothetical protein
MSHSDDESVPNSIQAPSKFKNENKRKRNDKDIVCHKVYYRRGVLLGQSFDSAGEGPLEKVLGNDD